MSATACQLPSLTRLHRPGIEGSATVWMICGTSITVAHQPGDQWHLNGGGHHGQWLADLGLLHTRFPTRTAALAAFAACHAITPAPAGDYLAEDISLIHDGPGRYRTADGFTVRREAGGTGAYWEIRAPWAQKVGRVLSVPLARRHIGHARDRYQDRLQEIR